MGNQLATVQATEVDLCMAHLPRITYQKTLMKSRLFRTFVGLHEKGQVVVKVYIKRGEPNLNKYEAVLQKIIRSLYPSPSKNIAPFQYFFETETAGFLLRQYFHSSLTDRIHTKPFLTMVEKKWIAFQLLHALWDAHNKGVTHGDIKSENAMVTTWNWICLVDFASYKPTFLPQDNPADYNFYYDVSGRRTCNIAPERFIETEIFSGPIPESIDRQKKEKENETNSDPKQVLDDKIEQNDEGEEPKENGSELNKTDIKQSGSKADRNESVIRGAGHGPIMSLLTQSLDPRRQTLWAGSTAGGTMRLREVSSLIDAPSDPSMDVFSLGCVIAEVFLDGESIFDYSQAVSYRKGDYDPTPIVSRIPDIHIRRLVLSMISPDPSKRRTCKQYINGERDFAFPAYFYTFLYDFFKKIAAASCDDRILAVEKGFSDILSVVGLGHEEDSEIREKDTTVDNNVPIVPLKPNRTHMDNAADDLLVKRAHDALAVAQRVKDSSTAAKQTESDNPVTESHTSPHKHIKKQHMEKAVERLTLPSVPAWVYEKHLTSYSAPLFRVQLHRKENVPLLIPVGSLASNDSDGYSVHMPSSGDGIEALELGMEAGMESYRALPTGPAPSAVALRTALTKYKGADLAVFVTLVCTSLRNVREPQTKLTGMKLLLRLGELVSDDLRMQRCIPFAISMLSDETPFIRASAVRILTELLSHVKTLQISDSAVFQEYILPSLSMLPSDEEELVRAAYAECLGKLASTGLRFLEVAQLIASSMKLPKTTKQDETLPTESTITFDDDLMTLRELMLSDTVTLLSDSSNAVRRAILSDISTLCAFFGAKVVEEGLMPYLFTLANDLDWELRHDLYHSFLAVGAFVGEQNVRQKMLPFLLQAIMDESEVVIEKALSCLACFVELRLLDRTLCFEAAEQIAPLICHPCSWIRKAAVGYMAACSRILPFATIHCDFMPLLEPYMTKKATSLTETALADSLVSSLSYSSFHWALDHADIHGTLLFGSGNPTQKSIPSGQRWHGSKSSADSEEHEDDRAFSEESTNTGVSIEMTDLDKNSSGENTTTKITPEKSSDASRKVMFNLPADQDDTKTDNFVTRSRSQSSKPIVTSSNERRVMELMKPWVLKTVKHLQSRRQIWYNLYSDVAQDSVKSRMSISESRRLVFKLREMELNQYRKVSQVAGVHQVILPDYFNPTVPDMTDTDISASAQTAMELAFGPGPTSEVSRFQYDPWSSARWKYEYTAPTGLSSPGSVISRRSASFTVPEPRVGGHERRLTQGFVARLDDRRVDTNSLNDVILGTAPTPLSAKSVDVPGQAIGRRGAWRGDLQSLVENRMLHVLPQPPPNLAACRPPIGQTLLPRGARILSWRPKGVLVAHLPEHRRCVNRLAVSSDDAFVASASDDGSVKIWDATHVERRAAARSRLTYSSQGGRITDLTVLSNTHSLASASSNGTCHVFRVDIGKAYATARPSKQQQKAGIYSVKNLESLQEDPITCVTHFNTDSASIVSYATQSALIHSWDLRLRTEPWIIELERYTGAPTTMTVPPGSDWMAIGTNRGYIVLYDLRYLIPVEIMQLKDTGRINKLQFYHGAGGSGADKGSSLPWLYVAAQSRDCQVALWDISKKRCKQLFSVQNENSEKPIIPQLVETTGNERQRSTPVPPRSTGEVRAMLAHRGCPYVIAGGSDRVIRYWDMHSINNSYIVNGPANTRSHQFRRKYEKVLIDDVTVCHESLQRNASISKPMQRDISDGHTSAGFPPLDPKETPLTSSLSRRSVQVPPMGIKDTSITVARDDDYSVHSECITDLCVVEQPRRVLFSASRDGVIKVYR